MQRTGRWAALTLAVLWVSQGQAVFFGVSTGEEARLGREAASLFEQHVALCSDPLLVGRVASIGRRIVSVCDRRDLPFEFRVVSSSDVNALCFPGGHVYVYVGLLQALPSDDALAFVLAHEVVHGAHRHWASRIRKSETLSFLTLGWGSLLDIFLQPKYSRGQEREADTMGMAWATKAGYDPNGSVEAMTVLRKLAGSGRRGIAIFRSHPPTDDRIKYLQDESKKLAAGRTGAGAAAPSEQTAAAVTGSLPAPPAGTDQVPAQSVQVGDLSAFTLAPNPFLPLSVGSVWRYRVTIPGSPVLRRTTRVLEEIRGHTGVFRCETDYGAGVKARYQAATTAAALLRRVRPEDAASAWQTEAAVPDPGQTAGAFRCVGEEAVSVPLGKLQAMKVEKLGPDGQVQATLWVARGTGVVRSQRADGTVEEIEFYQPGGTQSTTGG